MKTETVYISPYGTRFSDEKSAELQVELQRLNSIQHEIQKTIKELKSTCTHTDVYVDVRYSDYSESYQYKLECKCCGYTQDVRSKSDVPSGAEFR